jgi:outer membrane protein OmpA-like peptidoglycan-associated protein
MTTPPPRKAASGSSYAPILIIIGALVISAAIFFIFTRPTMDAKRAKPPATAEALPQITAPTEPAKPTMTAPSEGTKTPPATAATTPPPPTKPLPKAPAASMTYGKPDDLAQQFARALASGDTAAAAQLATVGGTPEQQAQAAAVLDQITKGLGFKIGPLDKVQVLGQAGEATRISIPLLKPGETTPSLELQIDLVRDAQTGWKVSQIRLPKELQSALAASAGKPMPASTAATPDAGAPTTPGASVRKGNALFTIDADPDPLSIANVFVQALLHHDLSAARALLDTTKVQDQKLAGLCIVFEEGDYTLKAGKPLVMTVASPSDAWVIAQIKSEKLQQATEFGLEMQREEGKSWRITGLNLSDLLGSFAKSAGKLGVPYTPLVTNPMGGESLALYFEYDQAELHPRAQKQLEIVASLLKANSSRKLRITGHTDAKGTDDYNHSLSQKRALAVKLKLGALGVPPEQVVTEARGKDAPISPNQKADGSDDPEGRSRNRRAEIFLDF